jgi:hypothetical protein
MTNINVKIKEFVNAKKGDILYFDGNRWVPASLEFLFQELEKKIQENKEEIEAQKVNLRSTKEQLQKELTEQRQAIAELLKGIVK